MVTINDLPMEIIHMILINLKGTELMKCRRLNQQFRAAVDSLPESYWKKMYFAEQPDPHKDKDCSRLSWQQLYYSVSLWENVEEARPAIKHKFPPKNIVDMKLLNDALVLIHTSVARRKYLQGFYGDTVIHYNLENFEEIRRKKYDYHFINYNENKTFIVYIEETNEIHIYEKDNPNNFRLFGLIGVCTNHAVYYLCNNKVFFSNHNDDFCTVYLKQWKRKKEIRVKTFEMFCGKPLAYSHECTGEDCDSMKVNILNRKGDIFTFIGDDTDFVCVMSDQPWFHLNMEDYIFDWTAPRVLEWLYDHYHNDSLGITTYNFCTIHEYKNVLFIGTTDAKILVYVNPYIPNGGLRSFDQESDLKIDLSKLSSYKTDKIPEIRVWEILNGHRIAVLISRQVILVDLKHLDDDY